MNARLQFFLQTLQTQVAQFQSQPQYMTRISTAEVARLAALSSMSAAPVFQILRALSLAMPSLEAAAAVMPDLEMTLNEARPA